MNTELTLQIPDSLLLRLENQAREQGVSLETLCLSLLSGLSEEGGLVDPLFYQSLDHVRMRHEVTKVIGSSLPSQEVRKRLNKLEFEISRRYR